ncbi:MAG: cytochrome c biogenesis protein CcdA [Armatimonadota bacterium]|nr:cytochrome c biogenesis protein CcdA [Armatimonadota bacterium]
MNLRTYKPIIAILVTLATASSARAQMAPSSDLVKITAALSVDKLAAGSKFKAAVVAEVRPGLHVNAPSSDTAVIPPVLSISAGPGVKLGRPEFPPPVKKKFAFTETPIPVYEGRFKIIVPGEVAKNAKVGPRTLRVSLTYQACDDNACYPPGEAATRISTRVAPAGTAKPANGAVFCEVEPEPGVEAQGMAGKLLGALKRSNPLIAALISFLLGLTLCLTPCVYPMIPVTIGFFAGQSEGRKEKLFTLALLYVIGMAITYSALGVLAASFGTIVGAAFQNPYVVGLVAAVFVALALGMFGMYDIQPPAFIMNRTGAKSGAFGALLMGLMLGVVASPCIGPAVVGVAVWVTQLGNAVLGFWIFFSLALGLGLPFLILAMFSGAISRLPQAGMWMVSVKKLSGLVLLGAAAYFIQFLLPLQAQRFVLPVFLLVVAVYLTAFKSSLAVGRASVFARPVLGIAVGLAALWFLAPHAPRQHVGWTAYTPQSLEKAAADGRPVIIDFTAKWCGACKELDDKTFTDPTVVQQSCLFARLRADLTRRSPETDALVKRFDVRGLPTVIFIDSAGQEVRARRVVGFVPPKEFLDRMSAVH